MPFLCLMYSPCSYHQNELLTKSLYQPQPEIWLIKTEAFSKCSYKWPVAACDVTAIISAMAAMCKLKRYEYMYYLLSLLIDGCNTGINRWLIIRVLGSFGLWIAQLWMWLCKVQVGWCGKVKHIDRKQLQWLNTAANFRLKSEWSY